jgi:hypothetical protein
MAPAKCMAIREPRPLLAGGRACAEDAAGLLRMATGVATLVAAASAATPDFAMKIAYGDRLV